MDCTETEHLIEGITRRAIEAVNGRHWDIKADPWIYFAQHDILDVGWRNDLIVDMQDTIFQASGHHFVDFERQLTIVAPEFHVRIVDIETTVLDMDKGFARVMLNAEETGVPVGVVRPTICLLDFRRRNEVWMCERLRALPGVEYGG